MGIKIVSRKSLIPTVLACVLLSPMGIASNYSEGQGSRELVSIQLLKSSRQGVVIEVRMADPNLFLSSLEDRATGLSQVPGLTLVKNPGFPRMPVVGVMVGVPPVGEVSLRVLAAEKVSLPGTYTVPIAPQPAPLDAELVPGGWESPGDSRSLLSIEKFPPSPARLVDEAWIRSQRIVKLEFYPFQYEPSTGHLTWHPRIQVEIRFDSVASSFIPPSPPMGVQACGPSGACDEPNPFETVYRQTLLNYDQARDWRLPPRAIAQIAGQSPVQAVAAPVTTGEKYKIVVDQDGVYTVTYADLAAAGMAVDSVDPQNFHLTNQGRDVAIYVEGEGDGRFDPGDRILFYGERFRGDYLANLYQAEDVGWIYLTNAGRNAEFNATMVEKYTDENVYWLSVGTTPGLRMASVDGTPINGYPIPSTFTEVVHAEESRRWWSFHFTGEDTWFWDWPIASGSPITTTYPITLTSVATGAYTATVRGEVVAASKDPYNSPDHHTRFYINDVTQLVEDSTWDNATRHKFQGQVPQSYLQEGGNNLIYEIIPDAALTNDRIWFDWFEVAYQRLFIAVNDQLKFRGDEAGGRQYQLTQFDTPEVQIFDITLPLTPVRILSPSIVGSGSPYTVTFEVGPGTGAEFIAAGSSGLQAPKELVKYVPPDFASLPEADYLFITHRDFVTATQRLADYRAGQGLSTLVLDVDDLYNEFNYGIYHPVAIKNFLAYTFDNWANPPTYVLLIGGGHWNFKGDGLDRYGEDVGGQMVNPPIYMPPYLTFVDPWQGEVDSANQLAMLVGDDILPDVLIGRLPVLSEADLNTVIDKIINYESLALLPEQSWQTHFTFVADDTPDAAGDFVALAEQAINELPSRANVDRIYLDDYPGATEAREAITSTLNITGTLFLNYIGHGSVERWAHEKIFRNEDVGSLTNIGQLPVVLSMTCLDGYWIYPTQAFDGNPTKWVSLVETLLWSSTGGAVSTFSATGLGVATAHDVLHSGFYQSVFQDDELVFGAATLAAKLKLYATGNNLDLIQTFTVFGDPALRLLVPLSLRATSWIYLPLVSHGP